ncbi:MAG: SDR family NAD(P)-dependent oxidoreductase, partial [Cyanobacteria bacterium J06649_5]
MTTARRVLITGASSGIGKASAEAFAQAGFDVALVARSQNKLRELATHLRQLGIEAHAFALELADLTQVKANIKKVVAAIGSVDVLINSAGMGYTGNL